ncbi:DUF308 domain-containing protein, partial [Fusobacterium polymorphum]
SIAILALPMFSISMVLWTFIFFLVFVSLSSFRSVLKNGFKPHLLPFLLAFIAVASGIILLFNPLVASNTIARILAFFVIMNGTSHIFSSIIDIEIE